DFFPRLAIGGRPHIPRRGFEGIEPSAENPHLILKDHFSLRIPRLPSRLVGDTLPFHRRILCPPDPRRHCHDTDRHPSPEHHHQEHFLFVEGTEERLTGQGITWLADV